MDINILFMIVTIILAIGAIWGWKRGLLESVIRIISGILGIIVIAVIAKGIGSFMQGKYTGVFMALALLVAISIIHKTLRFLFGTFRLVRAVPAGKFADKLAGAIFGIAEAILIIWFGFLMIGSFNFFDLKDWMLEQVDKSQFLSILYYSNYLIKLLSQIL